MLSLIQPPRNWPEIGATTTVIDQKANAIPRFSAGSYLVINFEKAG